MAGLRSAMAENNVVASIKENNKKGDGTWHIKVITKKVVGRKIKRKRVEKKREKHPVKGWLISVL